MCVGSGAFLLGWGWGLALKVSKQTIDLGRALWWEER